MPTPLRAGLASAAAMTLFAELTGHDAGQWQEACGTAPAGRLVIVMLAPVVTAFEHAMTDVEGRNAWRTDRYSPCPRIDAATYLTFLASLGYQMPYRRWRMAAPMQATRLRTPWPATARMPCSNAASRSAS